MSSSLHRLCTCYCMCSATCIMPIELTSPYSRQGSVKTRTTGFLLGATLSMFILATGSWVVAIADVLQYLPHRLYPGKKLSDGFVQTHNAFVTAKDVFNRIVYIFSDLIVVQRAWILWSPSLRVKLLLSLCVFATVGKSRMRCHSSKRLPRVHLIHCSIVVGSAVDLALDLKDRWNGVAIGHLKRALIIAIPTLLTNIYPTCLIASKAW